MKVPTLYGGSVYLGPNSTRTRLALDDIDLIGVVRSAVDLSKGKMLRGIGIVQPGACSRHFVLTLHPHGEPDLAVGIGLKAARPREGRRGYVLTGAHAPFSQGREQINAEIRRHWRQVSNEESEPCLVTVEILAALMDRVDVLMSGLTSVWPKPDTHVEARG